MVQIQSGADVWGVGTLGTTTCCQSLRFNPVRICGAWGSFALFAVEFPQFQSGADLWGVGTVV